jgi:hypothetical protein
VSAAAEGAPDGVPKAEVDRLYGLPLEDFTRERDALAKRARDESGAEAARWVRGLRKPTLAAWAVNQAVRSQPRTAREFLKAGEALRESQARVLAGKAGAEEVNTATEAERAATGELVAAARGLLTGTGRSLGDQAIDRVAETLHAATLDNEVRAEVEAGRVVRERRATGLGPFAQATASGPAKAAGRTATRPKRGRAASTRAAPSKGKAAGGRAGKVADVRGQLRAARQELTERKRGERAAKSAAGQAERRREQAERAAGEADKKAEDARSRLKEAEQAAVEASESLEAARSERERAEARVRDLERRAKG